MKTEENINALYIYEQNLLKSCVSKLLESSNEILHDSILSIFDNIDEITRKLQKYIQKKENVPKERINRMLKEKLYEELDSMYLRINE